MKSLINTRTFALLFLIALTFSCKKDELPDPEVPEVPDVPSEPTLYISQPGTPTGSPTSASIGTAGGSLSTPDGAITLTFPAGALNSDTEISITPITNTAPQGIASAAFRLQPEGLVFNAPVEVKFNYENFDLSGSPEEFLWINTQAADGSWMAALRSEVNTANNTVKVDVPHFSDWVVGRFIKMAISPASATLAKGQSIRLFTTGFRNQGNDAGADDLAPLYPIEINEEEPAPLVPQAPAGTNYSTFELTGWALNGVNAPVSGSNGNLTPDAFQAVYQAPQQVPSPNTVAISLNLQASNTLGGVNNFILVSNITIIDAEYYLTLSTGGLEETYYQNSTNANEGFTVASYTPDGYVQINAQIIDGSVVTQSLLIRFLWQNTGIYSIASAVCNNEDEDVFYLPNSNSPSIEYTTQNILRSPTASGCEVSYDCNEITLTITSLTTTPLGKVIEGSFSGNLYSDLLDSADNCQSSNETDMSGTFRLIVAGL